MTTMIDMEKADQIDKAIRDNYRRSCALATIVINDTTDPDLLEAERQWLEDDFGDEPGFADIDIDFFRAQYIVETEDITVDDARAELETLEDEARRLRQYKADFCNTDPNGHTAQQKGPSRANERGPDTSQSLPRRR